MIISSQFIKLLGITLIILFAIPSYGLYASPEACKGCINTFHDFIQMQIGSSIKYSNYLTEKERLNSSNEKIREEILKQDYCAFWMVEKLVGHFKDTQAPLGFNISCITDLPRLKSLHLPRHHSEKKAFRQWDKAIVENADNFKSPRYSRKGINKKSEWYEYYDLKEKVIGRELDLHYSIRWLKINSVLKRSVCNDCHDPLPSKWAISYGFYYPSR